MKRVSICTLGCKTNQFESAAMVEQLKAAGYDMRPFGEFCDIYIINSCTVTAKTDAETRRLIRRARRLNPEARIIATGCYAQVAPGELEKMPELDSVLGNREKGSISTLIESPGHSVTSLSDTDEPLTLTSFAEHTRAFLQIQNGCNSFCSYCIVPYARGRSRSVRPEDVLQGMRDLAANGYKEIVLTGIHLGAYGLDLEKQTGLTEIVRMIDSEKIVPRLRIGSIEPNEVTDDLLHVMAASGSICPHLHLPLQSGSDAVLRRMRRHYTADFFKDLIQRITTALPDAFIGADVIAGFPGETDAEFAETVKLIEELPFSDLHVFPYSSRPGTKAADLPGHLDGRRISERAAYLRKIAARKKQEFLQKLAGSRQLVLVQQFDKKTALCRGLSRNYTGVVFKGDAGYINCEVPVVLTQSDGKQCSGNILPQ